MSRSRARASRVLIGFLAVAVVIVVFAYWNNARQGPAEAVAAAGGGADPAPVAELPPQPRAEPIPPPLVTQTPLTPVPADLEPADPEPQTLALAPTSPPTPAEPPARPARSSARPLVEARAQMDSGDMLAARAILNQALLSRQMGSADTEQARRLIQEINQDVIFSPRRFPNDEFGGTYNVQPGDLLSRIARDHNVTWQFLARINGISDPRRLRAGQTLKVIQGPFHAVVTKSAFTMDIYLGEPEQPGSLFIARYPVGLGENDSTPAGVWLVEPQKKLPNPTYYSPRGEGVIPFGDPRNPLGTHWIGLLGLEGEAVGKTSYGIHGTIEPESIGRMESMGCIRLHNEDVAVVFDLLVENQSRVIVRD